MFGSRRTSALSRVVFALVMAAAVTAALFVAHTHVTAAGQFTPGNIVVYRIGTGTGALVNTGNPVFLDEYTPAGVLVQSVALPTATNGANHRLIASGTATSEGLLTRSADGLYLLATGYDSALGVSSLAGTTSTAVPRVVGRVDGALDIDTTTALTDWASGNNPRSATSSDGTNLWIGGAAGGVRYATLGATTSTQLSSTVTNIRAVEIAGGQVYNSDSSGSAVRIGAVGTGLPTTAGQTITNLPGFPVAGSPYAFFFADLDGTPGVDTLYVTDDTATTGGITKYSLVGGLWTSNGTIVTSSGAPASQDFYRGVTGTVSGTSVTLYLARNGGTGATGGGQIALLVDNSGFNGALAGTPVLLATAAANTAFRGIALAPDSLAITSQPVSQTIFTGATATLSVTAAGIGPFSYQWYAGNSGDTSNPVGGANASSFTTPALTIAANYWVKVSNSLTSLNSATAAITVQTVVAPAITVQPVGAAITSGGSATLTVMASGDAPLSYQWYIGTSGNPTSPITDGTGTSNSFTTPPLFATTSYWARVSNPGGSADSNTATVSLPACTSPHIPINVVQGTTDVSPYAGQNQPVTVRGVVVGDYEGPSPALRGFYLQDLPADDDGNPATSEGIFVFESNNAHSVSVGQVVQVTGVVNEFLSQTEIDGPSIESCGTTAAVTPTDVTLPTPAPMNGVSYLERFEGMLVRFHQTLYVTEHFQLGEFGQIVMSSNGKLPQPTNVVLPGAQAQALEAANNLNRITVDDDTNAIDPDPIEFGRGGNQLTALNTLRGGDTATDIVGILGYGSPGSGGTIEYRLRPVNAMGGGVPVFQAVNARPSAPPAVGGRLKVTGMNVENFFLTLDNGQAICGPVGSKQDCRGANTAEELAHQQAKLNAALIKINGDIVGMSELENTQDNTTGQDVNPLNDIVNRLNTSLGSNVYTYINTGIIGTDDIRVGIIYKPANVTPIGSFLFDSNPVHNRPPVAQLFQENSSGERFSVVVNHFRSKGCGSSSNPLDADQGDGQSCFNATRVAQAQALLSFVKNTVIPTNGDPDVLMVGDFNSYAKEDPIHTIEQAGFTNLVARFQGASAYSYLFNGEWGYIDQALASTSLLPQVTSAGDYHINSDEPSVLDYNEDFKDANQKTLLYNADEFRIADHDPVVIGVALQQRPQANADAFVAESGTPLTVGGGSGVLANDGGGQLAIFSHTNPLHGTLSLNADGSFSYTPTPGFIGTDSFTYTANGVPPAYDVLLYSTNLPPLATIGGVNITAGGFGSSLYPVPGSPNEFYGLTDRGPNVDSPDATAKVEPLPGFVPSIGKFLFSGDEAILEQIIPLRAADGTPYSGRVNSEASTGEIIEDLNGNILLPDPNGYDSEGLVALPDGTFWVSDEYGPFITHFDASGLQIGRLSPFDGSLPSELAKRVPNKGMEGLTITPDGTMLVGMMQSALMQSDLGGANPKNLTPLRIVTYRLADGAVHEYLYLLDNPSSTGTAVSEITALTNTMFLVDERDGNFPPGAYKKLYLIDISGATDIGPQSTVPGAVYDGANGGLLVGGQSIERLLKGLNTAASTPALTTAGITTTTKSLYLDINALITSINAQGHFFGHDKMEGVAALDGGTRIIISNDSDFGIVGSTGSGPSGNLPPFQLTPKILPSGAQDDGEFLEVDLVSSTNTVTITTNDTTPPDTTIDNTPTSPTASANAVFVFHGTDSGSGVVSFACALDGAPFTACVSPIDYAGLSEGVHTFSVRALDVSGNTDPTPASVSWTVDLTPPSFAVPANQTIEATGPNGAVANFALPTTAVDAVDGSDPVACVGGISGATFPLGTTVITCSSSDQSGNAASRPFSITVRDTTPPVIDAHADVTASTTDPDGTAVSYTSPSTHDAVSGASVAICLPASGSLFHVGSTVVTCRASDAAGNPATPTTFNVIVSNTASPISRFVAFSRDLTWLRAGSTAMTGDVGANERRHQDHHNDWNTDDGDRDDVTVRIGIGATMQQSSSRVVGDTVFLLNRSSIDNVVDNFLLNNKGTVLGTKTSPMVVPFTTLPAFPVITPGTQDVTVAKNKTLTLSAGSYRTVHVDNGGTLVLTGGLYQMDSLQIDQSATVLFHAATTMRIKTELGSLAKAKLILDPSVAGLRASQMVIYVGGLDQNCHDLESDDDGDDAGPVTVHIGSQNIVQANIYAANGTVWLKSKTQATGAFIGMHVRIGVNATLTLDSAF